mmetsp:Transcript_18229/g.20427  ORF Transcript_18229/g.20427 Transcript_18229/m.20427 type:complete len:100 (+) Transcript_18229:329-628(+)
MCDQWIISINKKWNWNNKNNKGNRHHPPPSRRRRRRNFLSPDADGGGTGNAVTVSVSGGTVRLPFYCNWRVDLYFTNLGCDNNPSSGTLFVCLCVVTGR